MAKPILEVELKISETTHRKNTKGGVQEYHYGALTIHNPELVKYIGKTVKVKVEKIKEKIDSD